MPILWSLNMKDQHQASAQDLEKRLKFLDEYKRIRDEAAGEIDGNEDEKEGEETQDVSPSSAVFPHEVMVHSRAIAYFDSYLRGLWDNPVLLIRNNAPSSHIFLRQERERPGRKEAQGESGGEGAFL